METSERAFFEATRSSRMKKATPETAPPHVASHQPFPARPARITGGHHGRLAPPVPFDGFSRRQATPFAGKRFKRGSAARRFQ